MTHEELTGVTFNDLDQRPGFQGHGSFLSLVAQKSH